MLRSHLHKETRRNIHVKTSTKMSKLVIDGVTIVRVGNEIRYSIPEGMTGKVFNEILTKSSKIISDYKDLKNED
tara:strand:+ start:78 stop:299 length:222 start_codon:yes stop_codon:yes gene_type:complete